MKAVIIVMALISSQALAFGYYDSTSRRIGNTIYTDTYGSGGYNSNITTRQIGNTTYSNGYDNRGNSINCTTQRIGSYEYTNCY